MSNEAGIILLALYFLIVGYWKYILAAVLILVLIGWGWSRVFRKR